LSTDRAILAMPSSTIAVHDPLLYDDRICITDFASDGYAAATYAVHALSSIEDGLSCSFSQALAPRARRSATSSGVGPYVAPCNSTRRRSLPGERSSADPSLAVL